MLHCFLGAGVSRPGLALWAGRPAPCARLLLPLSQQGQDIRTNTQQSGLLLYGRPLRPNAYKRTSTLRTSARWPPLSQPVRSKQVHVRARPVSWQIRGGMLFCLCRSGLSTTDLGLARRIGCSSLHCAARCNASGCAFPLISSVDLHVSSGHMHQRRAIWLHPMLHVGPVR